MPHYASLHLDQQCGQKGGGGRYGEGEKDSSGVCGGKMVLVSAVVQGGMLPLIVHTANMVSRGL